MAVPTTEVALRPIQVPCATRIPRPRAAPSYNFVQLVIARRHASDVDGQVDASRSRAAAVCGTSCAMRLRNQKRADATARQFDSDDPIESMLG
jgi:hypothetical protein